MMAEEKKLIPQEKLAPFRLLTRKFQR